MEDIRDYIPAGRGNAISRNYLSVITGMTDRAVREAIQAFNESGDGIICCEAGNGYFLPETKEEAEQYIRYSRSYLISLAKKDRAMHHAVEKMFSGQLELPV